MMGPAGPSRTSVLLGVSGTAAFRGEPRFADAFARSGLGFVLVDQPGQLFAGSVLTGEGKQIVEAIGDANLLLVAKGLDPAQMKALLGAVRKPVVLYASSVPGKDVLDLVKKTESTIGLVMGSTEQASAYFGRLDAARKAAGGDAVAMVSETSLWLPAARTQVQGVIGEMLKTGYALEDLANVTSGAFTRVLTRARAPR
jgi:hypothetical protein